MKTFQVQPYAEWFVENKTMRRKCAECGGKNTGICPDCEGEGIVTDICDESEKRIPCDNCGSRGREGICGTCHDIYAAEIAEGQARWDAWHGEAGSEATRQRGNEVIMTTQNELAEKIYEAKAIQCADCSEVTAYRFDTAYEMAIFLKQEGWRIEDGEVQCPDCY